MAPRRNGTRHVPRPKSSGTAAPRPELRFRDVTADDKARIGELMKEHFGWTHEPRPMQTEAGIAQLDGEDVIVHAPTGLGKTGIVAAPYAFPENNGRVTIFVSPLIALQEEMVTTFEEEYKLKAIAVNSTRSKSLRAVMKDICEGKYSIVLISPEMLQTRRFIDGVLRNAEFASRVLALVIDEAHTISHWGAHFRKKYSSLGVLRAFLPPKTSVVAMSASFTPRVRRDVLRKLQFGSKYHDIDLGNNRPNVAIVVRACHRQLGSFSDLDFVIPSGVQSPTAIPPTFIYCDKKEEGDLVIDHLRDLLPPHLRELGLVRPFNASMSHHYRKNALQHFRAGNIRVMVCTDAAGMGCNIPNIEVVVQWKLPDKLSMFVQRAGRAARRQGTKGLAVLLVEPTAYTEIPQTAPVPENSQSQAPKPSNGASKATPKAARKPRAPKGYAKQHGRHRGRFSDAATNEIDRTLRLAVHDLAEDEGLIVLVQTGDCRRRVIADMFGYKLDNDSVTEFCCDLCHPHLLARTLPGPPSKRKANRVKRDKKKIATDVIDALSDWRLATWKEDLEYCGFSDVAILSDERIQSLASVPEFISEAALRSDMGEWCWWPTYGKAVWRVLATVYDKRAEQALAAPAAPKRKRGNSSQKLPHTAVPQPSASAETATMHAAPSDAPPSKRPRVSIPAQASSSASRTAPAHGSRPLPELVLISPNETVPRAVRALAPNPRGDNSDPSRVVCTADGEEYYCAAQDGLWWKMPRRPVLQ